MSSSTVEAHVTSITGQFNDYLSILIDNFLPFLLGVGVILLVWVVARRLWYKFS